MGTGFVSKRQRHLPGCPAGTKPKSATGIEATSRAFLVDAALNNGRGRPKRLTQRNDEIRSFAGFSGCDALIGDDDRPAGRDRLIDLRQ